MKNWFKNLTRVQNKIYLKDGSVITINNNSSYTDKELWKWKDKLELDFRNFKVKTNDIKYWVKTLTFKK